MDESETIRKRRAATAAERRSRKRRPPTESANKWSRFAWQRFSKSSYSCRHCCRCRRAARRLWFGSRCPGPSSGFRGASPGRVGPPMNSRCRQPGSAQLDEDPQDKRQRTLHLQELQNGKAALPALHEQGGLRDGLMRQLRRRGRGSSPTKPRQFSASSRRSLRNPAFAHLELLRHLARAIAGGQRRRDPPVTSLQRTQPGGEVEPHAARFPRTGWWCRPGNYTLTPTPNRTCKFPCIRLSR